jgi:hypothetical protein
MLGHDGFHQVGGEFIASRPESQEGKIEVIYINDDGMLFTSYGVT